jgi:hypothetical protein
MAYESTDKTPQQIINEYNTFLSKYNLTTTFNKLSYLYIMYKAHKFGNHSVTAVYKVSTPCYPQTDYKRNTKRK